jgi:SAM-dependent methyltransferase
MSPLAQTVEKQQQQLYASSSQAVRAKGLTEHSAASYYSDYVTFVSTTTIHRGVRLLDVGCGNGWSSYLFAKTAYDVVGMDLNPGFFEPPPLPNLNLQKGSVMSLPYSDASFDLVASYQMLEHVPNPELALVEMLRVVKPGGTVAIVSPNLLSTLASFRAITWYVWQNRPLSTIVFRKPGMPRHPFGNTVPEVVLSSFRNSTMLVSKLIAKTPYFSTRDPDLIPPFHSDNDACYVCNPVDLVKFFRSRRCRVLQNGKPGRPPLSWLVATGTYISVQKT